MKKRDRENRQEPGGETHKNKITSTLAKTETPVFDLSSSSTKS